jgi:hypothetical protein
LSIIKTEIVLKESLKKELKKMEFINRFWLLNPFKLKILNNLKNKYSLN